MRNVLFCSFINPAPPQTPHGQNATTRKTLSRWLALREGHGSRVAAENILKLLLGYKFGKSDAPRGAQRTKLVADINKVVDRFSLPDFGQHCLDLVTQESNGFRSGLPEFFRSLLKDDHVRGVIANHIATSDPAVDEKTNGRHAETAARIADGLRVETGVDYSAEVGQRTLSNALRVFAPHVSSWATVGGIDADRKRALERMAIQLKCFDIASGQIGFAQSFNRNRWALPEALQMKLSELAGEVRKLAPDDRSIIAHRPGEHVSTITASWDGVCLAASKIWMKIIEATYGRYLEHRIEHCQALLRGEPDNGTHARETERLEALVQTYVHEYNQYSYFPYDISRYMKLDRAINRIEIEMSGLPEQASAKQRARLELRLGKLRSELRAMPVSDDAKKQIEGIYAADLRELKPDDLTRIQKAAIYNTGHAGNLIAVPAKDRTVTIITDPMFDDAFRSRMAPVDYPAETRIPIVAGDGTVNVPTVDYIFISHNHRDHVSPSTLRMLKQKNPGLRLIVPGGCTEEFVGYGMDRNKIIAACQWGMKIPLDSQVEMTITPAVHWSGSDRAKAGFNDSTVVSCVISSEKSRENIFYSGDTAAFQATHLNEIRDALGDERTNTYLLSSGPNNPQDSMKSTHQNTLAQLRFGIPVGSRTIESLGGVRGVPHPDAGQRPAAVSKAKLMQKPTSRVAIAKGANAFLASAKAMQLGLPYELGQSRIILTHHNQIHFGRDRFNESIYLLCKQMILLSQNRSHEELAALARRDKSNAYIYTETSSLMKEVEALYGFRKDNPQLHALTANFVLNRVQMPAIGAKASASQAAIVEANARALQSHMTQAAYEFRPG